MNTILALDIGTEFVKIAIAKQTKVNSLEILGVGKAKHSNGSMHAGAIANIPEVVSTCEKALAEAEEEAGLKANLAVVGTSNELIKGNTTSVHYTRKNFDKPITEAEMNEIIKKVQQKSGEVAEKTIALETGNESIEVRLINSAIISFIIDGHKVSNPIGFKGADISILFYTAFAPLTHVAAIEKVCAELNLDLLTIASEPFAICRACLGEQTDSNFSNILVDIGGEITNIAIISDGYIKGTRMFPIGSKNFTSQIENSPSVSAWLTGLEVVLEEFDDLVSLPHNLLLCGGGANSPIIQEQLAISDWYENLPFSHRPNIDLINASHLPDFSFGNRSIDITFITALGLLRVGLDTLAGAPKENRLKAKIDKLLQN